MREGERTMGVWLPLALADIYAALIALYRAWLSDEGRRQVRVPSRSETLGAWMLPMMARSVKGAEDESDALALYNSVKALADKQREAG